MEHIHGKLLDDGSDKVVVDEVDGYLGSHPRKNGSPSYFGYFEIPDEVCKGLDAGHSYRLVLDDGRSGAIYADVHPANRPHTMVAEFHVTGALKK